mmetsp:Transcript_26646/g.53133  ORF Transcript_26646/g.53133 Transcript_26646/m.53133 type:complete len:269 (-) Transcript_26646:662-1468(-)
MVVFLLMRRVKTPPRVSMPRERGVTSRRRMSLTSPLRTPPWMAAPMATTSSGFTPLEGFFPKKFSTVSCTLGMRLMPPTRMISWMSDLEMSASLRQFLQGSMVREMRGSTRASNWALVILEFMCLGPVASAVMNGRETSVWARPSSSRFAFSAASRRRCIARLSLERSIPDSFLKLERSSARRTSSKSSPPSMVSPFVDLTSNTPPEISRMDTSKVPPPRSKTTTVCPSALSMPYARAAAVGSLMMRRTSRPAILPASLVAWRWESLK